MNNCDVLLLFGYNRILHKDFLKLTKFGILSFHTADITKYRGRPAAFFEFVNDEKEGGLSLQILAEKIDGGIVLEKKNVLIEDCKSYDETLYKMMSLKNDLMISGIKKLEDNKTLKKLDITPKLSLNSQSRHIINVFKCLKKTIVKRYF